MARVFIHDADIETAVAVREAALADGHEAEILADLSSLEVQAAKDRSFALVLTGDLSGREPRQQVANLAAYIPRPPVIAVVVPDQAPDSPYADGLDLDAVLTSPVDPAEVQVTLTEELERFELQAQTGIVGRTDSMREMLERISVRTLPSTSLR
jgi:DNA-binding response OmpR family regulator